MLELDKDRFAQLLREVPEKDVLFPNPQYSPYIQSLIDRLKEEESLDLAAIDWSAFEMADVIYFIICLSPKSLSNNI